MLHTFPLCSYLDVQLHRYWKSPSQESENRRERWSLYFEFQWNWKLGKLKWNLWMRVEITKVCLVGSLLPIKPWQTVNTAHSSFDSSWHHSRTVYLNDLINVEKDFLFDFVLPWPLSKWLIWIILLYNKYGKWMTSSYVSYVYWVLKRGIILLQFSNQTQASKVKNYLTIWIDHVYLVLIGTHYISSSNSSTVMNLTEVRQYRLFFVSNWQFDLYWLIAYCLMLKFKKKFIHMETSPKLGLLLGV